MSTSFFVYIGICTGVFTGICTGIFKVKAPYYITK